MNPADGARQPWPGLESWPESESRTFSGRDKEIRDLLKLVRREVLSIVFGPSGTGKTSLLHAGLIPRLRESGYLPVSIRLDHSIPNPDYIGQARACLDRAIELQGLEKEKTPLPAFVSEPPAALWEFLYGMALWDGRNQLVTPVLIFDQFEEVFTITRSAAAAAAFLAELADLVENYVPARIRSQLEEHSGATLIPTTEPACRFILSLREDLLWHLDELRKAMPSVMHNRFLVSHMNTSQALLAVTGPGAGIVDESVAAQIVRFVAAEDAHRAQRHQVDPSLLSVVCRELNSRRIELGKETITADLLEESRAGILWDFYGRGFTGLDPAARVFIEDRLVTPSGFRGTVPVEEALKAGLSAETVRTLENRRLIRVEERLGIPHVELTHDVLTGVIRKSRAERQERERADREKQLREQEQHRAKEREALRIAELKRTRRLLMIVGSFSVACLAFAVLAFLSYRSSVSASYRSIFQLLTFEAPRQQMQNGNDDLAALLFLEAPSVGAKLSDPPNLQSDFSIFAFPEFRHVLGTHAQRVNSISYSRDGRLLASASEDGAIRVWDLKNPSTPPAEFSPGSAVEAVAFGPDGQTLASAGAEDFIRLWNIHDPHAEPIRLDGPKGGSWALAFGEGGLVAAGGTDGTIRIWNLATHRSVRIAVPTPTPKWIHSIAFSPDGRNLAAGSDDAIVRVWNLQDPSRPSRVLKGHRAAVYSVAFNRDSLLASASEDKTVRIWQPDVAKTDPLTILRDCYAQATSVAFDPAGKRLAAACGDQTVMVWDLDRPFAGPVSLAGHQKNPSTVAFNPDAAANSLASGGLDREVRVWDMKPKPGAPAVFRQAYLATLLFTPDGRLVSGGFDATETHKNRVNALLWNLRDPSAPPLEFAGGKGTVRAVAVSPDGKLLATAGLDGIARVWEIDSPGPERDFEISGKPGMNGISFSPDSRVLGAAADDGLVHFWNLDHPAEPMSAVDGVSGPIFSPDGRYVASGDQAGKLLIWDVGRIAASAKASLNPVSPSGFGDGVILAISPDWKKAATLTSIGRVLIWNLHESPESPLASYGKPLVLPDLVDTEEVAAMFSRDGRILAAGGPDRMVHIWNLDRPDDHAVVLKGFQGRVGAIAFSYDASRLAIGSVDGVARVWSLPPTAERDMVCRSVWRNLTQKEWDFFIGKGIPYRETCNLSQGVENH